MKPEKTFESWRVMRERRRHQYWRAAVVGLGAGALALAFQSALAGAEAARTSLLAFLYEAYPGAGWIVPLTICAFLGGLVAWATARFSPEASGSGIPHVKGVLMHVSAMNWQRIIPVKFIGGVLCIGSGFSLGREGPTVQMGAAVGKLVADVLRVPPKATPRLIACGAGSGLAAAFHAPLAGFIFTIEELQREFSALTYTMALIAAVVGDIIATAWWGSGNVFHVEGFPAASLRTLPLMALVGLFAGVLGAAFNRSLLAAQARTQQFTSFTPWMRGALAGAMLGFSAWWLPDLAGGGHQFVERILGDGDGISKSLLVLAGLLAGKFLLTIISYASGVPGGIFAPMLVMGACLGLLFGTSASVLFPSWIPYPQSFAAIGMAAFFAAVVRAPLTGIVLVLEMTGDYHQLLPLLIGSMVAYVISERLGIEPVYEALLANQLHRKHPDIPAHREPVLLEFVVQQESAMDGKAIKEIPIPERCLFVTISRHGHDILPDGNTVLARGDHVTAVVSGADAGESVVRVLSLSKV